MAPSIVLAQSAQTPPTPQEEPRSSVEARVWVDRGDEPVLRRGDRVRVYYRTSADAFISIFHIDTNGGVRLLYPSSPEVDPFVAGGRDYRLLFPRASQWYVDEDPGVGYYFIVASPEPLDFRDFRFSYETGGWDLSFAGRTVYEDPFVAMDEYIARLIPDWEYADYALDYLEYHVGDRHDYPRFLCYDCHGFSPYSTWNPYLSACSSFTVVAYNDPWFYPVNRYVGGWVVWARPPIWGQPRYVFRDRRPGDPWGPIVEPRPSVGDRPGIPGDAVQRRSGAGIGSGGRVPLPPRPGGPGTIERRSRPSTSSLGRDPRNGGRPVLERRSGTGTGTGAESGGGVVRRPDRTGGGAAAGPTRTTPRGSGVEVIRGRPGSGSISPPSTRESSGEVRRPSGSSIPGTFRVPNPTARERPSAVRGGGTSRSTPSAGTRATPGRSGSGGGTVIRRAPPSRSSGGVRTPTRVRPSGGASPSTSRSGIGSGSVRSAPRSGTGGRVRSAPQGSGGGAARAPARSSGGIVRSPPRSGGGGVSRSPTRTPSSGVVRSTAPRSRSGGAVRSGTTRARPGGSVRAAPSRSGSGSVRRAPVRSGGRGGVSRVRPRGGGLVP